MTVRHKVIGIGGKRTHLEGYIRAFAADPRCEVVAIADEPDLGEYREGLNRLLASELGVPYLRLDDALEVFDADIAVSCPDIKRRARVNADCFAAGLHVYLDKPLAGSVDDALSIADDARAAGTVTQMFSHVNTPWATSAKRAVSGGATGRPLAIHADMLMAKGHLGNVPPDYARKERGSDGRFTFVKAKREMFDMGVYPVAMITWLSGRRAVEVTAITANYFFDEHLELNIEDYGVMAMTLDDGTIATVACGRIGINSHPQGGPQGVTVIGEKGYFRFDESEPRIEIYNNAPPVPTPPRHPMDPMMMWGSTRQEVGEAVKNNWTSLAPGSQPEDIRAFLDCIDSGERPQITAADAVHHIEIIEAAYESAKIGKPVSIGA